jgi:GMP synthase-like glutamine amidotransferase
MRVHILQHVWFEGTGSAGPWFIAQGARVDYTRFFEADARLPDPRTLDLIVAMGGPMSVNDEAVHPWLREEKRFLAEAIRHGTPVLGICLGAQLIAAACGARVYRAPAREIGWLPVEGIPLDAPEGIALPPHATVFQWHGETFDLPDGAIQLARSAACENQAFQLGRSTLALQFHLETTPDTAALLVEQCGHELSPDPWVQTEAQILSAPASNYQAANALLSELLHRLVGKG